MNELDARERLAEGLRQGLARAAADAEPLDYDTLEAYVDGRLDEADREVVETRLEDDVELRAEVEELRALRAELGPVTGAATEVVPATGTGVDAEVGERLVRKARAGRPFFSVSPAFAMAASVVFVVGAGIAWWIRGANLGVDVERPIAGNGAASGAARPAPPIAAPAATADAGSGSGVRDGQRLVALAADRSVTGLDGLDPALRARVGEMLASGKLPAPAHSLSGAAGQLLSAPVRSREEVAAAFAVRTPVGTAVREPQPLFQWTPAAGATAYHVRVVDESLDVVAESEALTSTTWRPRQALPRGRVLQWQVEAAVSSGALLAPVPPEPEARFRVLTEAEDAELSRALAASGDSSLAALSVYAAAGLRGDARRVINVLVSANPNSPVLQSLYADLRRR